MNMHLHLHLKECVKDYGPRNGFWCFSFERANGILGDYHSNNRDTELNIMRKWLVEWQLTGKSLNLPSVWECVESNELPPIFHRPTATVLKAEKLQLRYDLAHGPVTGGDFKYDESVECILPPVRQGVMSLSDNLALKSMFEEMYPCESILKSAAFLQTF